MVAAYLLLGGFELEAFFFDEVGDHAEFFDVGGGVEADAFGVAAWVDDCEFCFPEAEGGWGEAEDFGYFADFVIFFVEVGGLHGECGKDGVSGRRICKSSKKSVILHVILRRGSCGEGSREGIFSEYTSN